MAEQYSDQNAIIKALFKQTVLILARASHGRMTNGHSNV
jgi:hypothetical protein